MLFEQLEPNERFRARREAARRRRRRRRVVLVGFPLGATATSRAARFVIGDDAATNAPAAASKPAATVDGEAEGGLPTPRALPDEVRGIHVTMALASLDGKLDEYLQLATRA